MPDGEVFYSLNNIRNQDWQELQRLMAKRDDNKLSDNLTQDGCFWPLVNAKFIPDRRSSGLTEGRF
jgi:hypothetical protein